MQLDGMAMVVATGFVLSLGAALGMLYSIVGTAGGLARQRRRRLAPSPDLPELVEHEDAVAQLLAHGLSPLAKLAKPVGEGELHALRAALSQAGFRGPQAVQVFLASRVIAAVACLAAVLWANAVRLQPLPMLAAWVLGAAAAGLFLPNLWLHARVQDRRKAVSRGLPDALDLLVTCVEAGLGLDSAIQRVAGEIVLAHRLLAEELGLTFLEVKAGVRAHRRLPPARRPDRRPGPQDARGHADPDGPVRHERGSGAARPGRGHARAAHAEGGGAGGGAEREDDHPAGGLLPPRPPGRAHRTGRS